MRREASIARLAEAAMLLCMSLVIWLIIATNKSAGGLLLSLGQLHPAMARVYVILVVLGLFGVFGSCLVAVRGSTSLGTVLCAASLIACTMIQNSPVRILESFVPKETRVSYNICHFYPAQSDFQGAELYVNGVLLGTLPLRISWTEFRDTIPVWKETPVDLHSSDIPSSLRTYETPLRRGAWKVSLYQRLHFKRSHIEEPEYYAQVKYRGQWCYSTDQGGSVRIQDGFIRTASFGLNFLCLNRERSLERLLDWARIKGYQVSDLWFEALETYGQDGVEVLVKAESSEPGMKGLLDQWASRRFRLDHVNDEATAWQAFDALCQTVTKAKAYSTEGLEGRAVTWLAPKLPVDQLANHAIQLLKGVDRLDWRYWKANGTWQFGYGADMVTSSPETAYSGSIGARLLPTRGYAVAHALKILFEQGDPRARDVLQHRVAPEILANFYQDLFRHGVRYRLLCSVGGPVLERFLLRQNWEADSEQLPSRQIMYSKAGKLNGWFYMMAHLETSFGTQFRQTHRDRLFQIADEVDDWHDREALEFLFLNPAQGEDSLAYQYWPRLLQNLVESQRRPRKLHLAYDYLTRMEPIAEPNMYVQAFKALHSSEIVHNSFKVLSSVPPLRRHDVYEALKEAIEADVTQLTDTRGHLSLKESQEELRNQFKRVLASDLENAEQFFQEIVERNPYISPVGWFQSLDSDHALIPMLALSDRADLRRLSLYAIESHPSPAHKILLDQLLQDRDAEVRLSAEAVQTKLNNLANVPVDILKAKWRITDE
ncbi:MAG: hypothetical protein HQ515_21555 [Phycisphaeraceae bacterium]|nr:hypothetical protein [Phycisphaeraceae bacterium]